LSFCALGISTCITTLNRSNITFSHSKFNMFLFLKGMQLRSGRVSHEKTLFLITYIFLLPNYLTYIFLLPHYLTSIFLLPNYLTYIFLLPNYLTYIFLLPTYLVYQNVLCGTLILPLLIWQLGLKLKCTVQQGKPFPRWRYIIIIQALNELSTYKIHITVPQDRLLSLSHVDNKKNKFKK